MQTLPTLTTEISHFKLFGFICWCDWSAMFMGEASIIQTAQSRTGVAVCWLKTLMWLAVIKNKRENIQCHWIQRASCHVSHTSVPVLSLNAVAWSREAVKIVLKTERAVFPGTLFKGWVKRHPNEEWQRYPARGQLPHSPCFSEPDKSAQGSSAILCVAVQGGFIILR